MNLGYPGTSLESNSRVAVVQVFLQRFFFFFFPAPFSRRRSLVDDCFTGQSPGNAISIPAAPDVHEGLSQIQASAP